MRVLREIVPSGEQLPVIQDHKPGVTLIRGAAGTGKTTTALLRLKFLASFWLRRRERLGIEEPVRILVLTYNRTLRGYIAELAAAQIAESSALELDVSTFGKWSMERLRNPLLADDSERAAQIRDRGKHIRLDGDFLVDEVDYALGRHLPDDILAYVANPREGRGSVPRVDGDMKEAILEDVIEPYGAWKAKNGFRDWNDLAASLALNRVGPTYDVLVVDEAQDFTANQVRALMAHLSEDHSVTFVLDAMQRIYPRYFTWREVGIDRFGATHRLRENHRNTVEIAAFARPLVEGLQVSDDGTLPDFDATEEHGRLPVVLTGSYSAQLAEVVRFVRDEVDLENESVAILHARGGGWLDYTREQLQAADIDYVELARRADWPTGPENVALSTLHSAKGLEFDHVVIIGLNRRLLYQGTDPEDARVETLRRLLAMAIGRARLSVTLGFKADEEPQLVSFLTPETYTVKAL